MTQLTVRAAGPADADAIATVYAPYVTGSAASFETDPPDAEQIRTRMAARPRRPWYVAELGGQVVGFVYAATFLPRAAYDWSVAVSVYLAPTAHRRGVGRALYTRLLAELRGLGYVRAYALITEPNPASTGLHGALGFTRVGLLEGVGFKDGRWRDVGWWELVLRPAPDLPAPPAEWDGR